VIESTRRDNFEQDSNDWEWANDICLHRGGFEVEDQDHDQLEKNNRKQYAINDNTENLTTRFSLGCENIPIGKRELLQVSIPSSFAKKVGQLTLTNI
jgi:hypothetical protein